MLMLTPQRPKHVPVLPENNTDVAKEAATELTLDSPLNIPEKTISVLRVKTGHFTVNISVNTLRKSDRLVVTFTGPRTGGKDSPNARRPMFQRRQWDVLFEAPILAISDPQTEIEWNADVARTGFYMGTFQHDLVPELNALIDKVCDELGISRDRVVLYGASSGGTAAMLVGSRRRTRTGVIAVCPYLRPDKYRDQAIAIGARAMGGELADWERMTAEEPWRSNPLTALRDGINDGHDIKVVVAQNLKDKSTINRHYPGLWRRFDIDPDGGISPSGRVMGVLYESQAAGHGNEPKDCSVPLVKLAYEFFDQPVTPQPKKPGKPKKLRPAATATASAATAEGAQAAEADEDDEE